MFWLGIRKRAPLAPAVACFGAMALAYAPWAGVVWDQAGSRGGWMRKSSFHVVWKVFESLCSGHPFWLLGLLLLAALLHRLDSGATSRASKLAARTPSLLLLLGLWAAVPLLVQILVTRAGIPVFSVRNLIIILPPFILVAAVALRHLDTGLFNGLPVASACVIVGCCWT